MTARTLGRATAVIGPPKPSPQSQADRPALDLQVATP